jgi:hypothetical protein
MHQKQAEMLAKAIGGDAWNSGGDIWLVTLSREDGSLVVFSGDAVCEYKDQDAFDAGRAASTILLMMDERSWVVCDAQGHVFYRDDQLVLGWRTEEEARQEARGLQSRGEGAFFVREE